MHHRLNVSFPVAPVSINIAGQQLPKLFTAADLAAVKDAARRDGVNFAEGEAKVRLEKMAADVAAIQTQVLRSVEEGYQQAMSEMREILPTLVLEATARILADTEISSEVLKRIVDDLLQEVVPGADQIDVFLCPDDLKKMESFQTELRVQHPGIAFHGDSELRVGDCLVKTRYGVLDGRLKTKFNALSSLLK